MQLLQKIRSRSKAKKQATQQSHKLEEKYYFASQWKLMWWKFLDHKVAVFAGAIVLLLYLIAIFCEFIAPHKTKMAFIFDHSFMVTPDTLIQKR